MSSTSTPPPPTTMVDTTFSKLTDDIILQIFFQLQDDPRNWARLSCVCTKFNSLITSICCKSKCISFFNSLSSDLLSLSSTASSSWASLYKIAVCCPGLLHAGVLLDNSDFGLHRELGPTEDYLQPHMEDIFSSPPPQITTTTITTQYGPIEVGPEEEVEGGEPCNMHSTHGHEFGGWSLYDDLYYDTIYDNSETSTPMEITTGAENLDSNLVETTTTTTTSSNTAGSEAKRRRVKMRLMRSHLASGGWSLSREQGNKLLGSRFRDDCLYISEWPGCVHIEEKRNYRLFRGIFHNFKRTRVWRTINDGNRSKIELNCAFCSCKETWDLHSAFCLKRGFGFHDDGEPVVRAYVCENGHVSGAWTDLPLYA